MAKTDTRIYIIPQLLDDKVKRPDRYVRARSNVAALMHVASDLAELDAWAARYLREYPPAGYSTMVLAGPYREAQHWVVKLWRGCSCE